MAVSWHKKKWGDDVAVPGQRMGGFILRKQPSDFLPADSQATLSDWSGRCGVSVETDGVRGLVDVTTGETRFTTEEGFGVGTAVSDIVAAWGPPDQEQALEGEGYFDLTMSWTRRGAGVAVKDGRVLFLSVFPAEDRLS